ncbi:F0F1 ATP synthase subunit B [filamentous cyanobacterium LEGE 11480]|uniref:ATP synthase subunit b n=1 Tax=Romeriopsis navalis LEGE 11480 TaxID=2777977 RepID=A0A928Z686_9CYAN|nr:F0F1 ATP synthase subunit B [Romeriopsis navalis]MBE9032777.1 F0F1 ATP synthase subunit B [Romeriopsis navalis LEGE 11480]
MDIVLQLATGATILGAEMAEAESKGFGLNFDIFEANLINLAIVIGIVFYFLKGFLSKTLSERSEAIATALTEAERKKAETAKALAAQQEKLKSAQAEAAGIVQQAQADAAKAREAILAKGKEDVASMKAAAAADMGAEEAKVMAELRQRIAELAMQQAGSELPGRLNADAQQRLIDRSISMLGGN